LLIVLLNIQCCHSSNTCQHLDSILNSCSDVSGSVFF